MAAHSVLASEPATGGRAYTMYPDESHLSTFADEFELLWKRHYSAEADCGDPSLASTAARASRFSLSKAAAAAGVRSVS